MDIGRSIVAYSESLFDEMCKREYLNTDGTSELTSKNYSHEAYKNKTCPNSSDLSTSKKP